MRLPICWRLYLPEVWCQDAKRLPAGRVPEEVEFQTKPEIALQQIRQALQQQVPIGVVLADAGYGYNTQFRTSLTQTGLHYMGGIETTTTVWEPGKQPLPARRENLVGEEPRSVCCATRITSRLR